MNVSIFKSFGSYGMFIIRRFTVLNKSISLQALMPCSIEKAAKHMLLHAKHAGDHGARVLIKTVDSDVLSVAVAAYKRLKSLIELWIEMGKGKHKRFLPIHVIPFILAPLKSLAVSFIPSISICDDSSGVSGKEKSLSLKHGH